MEGRAALGKCVARCRDLSEALDVASAYAESHAGTVLYLDGWQRDYAERTGEVAVA